MLNSAVGVFLHQQTVALFVFSLRVSWCLSVEFGNLAAWRLQWCSSCVPPGDAIHVEVNVHVLACSDRGVSLRRIATRNGNLRTGNAWKSNREEKKYEPEPISHKSPLIEGTRHKAEGVRSGEPSLFLISPQSNCFVGQNRVLPMASPALQARVVLLRGSAC